MTEIQHSGDRVALAVDSPAHAPWYGRKAAFALRTYPAWQADPTRSYLDTPLSGEKRGPAVRVPWRALLILFALGVPVVVGWLRFVR